MRGRAVHRGRERLNTLHVPLQELFNQYDLDHSGEIDYPEFLAMMRSDNPELQAASRHLRRKSLLHY